MTPFSAQTRLLVVAPHPDDETIAAGLLIQQVQAAGGEVRILLLTAGDNNPWPQRWLERRWRIGASERLRWGQRRQREMLRAMQCLDLPQTTLISLGWPDMGITDRLLQSTAAAVSELAEVLAQFQPSLVALPALDDCHPDHGSAHVLLRLALAGQADPPRLLAYLLHGRGGAGTSIETHPVGTQLTNKLAALAAHCSQLALSGTRMHRLARRPERYVEVVPSPLRATWALPWQPSAWLRPWLRISVVSPTGVQQWRWRDAPLTYRAGRFELRPIGAVEGVPLFIRLALSLPSPWIFDHWGWRDLSGCPRQR